MPSLRHLLLVCLLGTLGCGATRESHPSDASSEGEIDGSEETDADSEPATEDAEAEPVDAGSDASSRDAGARDAAASDAGAGADARMSDAGPAASTDGGSALCPGLGWCELTDTKLRSVCPDPNKYSAIQANEGCGGVINDWSGGSVDQKRNRLLIWGGGHRGYFGNEVYALDLNVLKLLRLNDPSDITGVDLNQCTSPEAYADGRPSSRHTYDGLAYLPDSDEMFALAGSGIPCGYAVQGTWTLDLDSVSAAPPGKAAPWTQHRPTPFPTKASFGVVADYDPNTKRVIVDDTYSLWAFDPSSHTYTLLNDSTKTGAHIDYHMTGRVDPKRKLFVAVGGKGGDDGGIQIFDIAAGSNYAQQDWTNQVQGCDGLLAASSPGLAYDPVQDRLVGWAGGDDVYLLDLDQKRCTTVRHNAGPGAQVEAGTFGRFRYI
ncbi:MAG TPA: hypothetical protein VJU61_07220, partial [Polyangiaceae bacterium]|nr:hypothetical protein [Polyangiaceae bacterium]